jgi:hypothetical protein
MNSKILPSLLLVLTACGLPDGSEAPENPGSKAPASDRIFYTVTKVEGTYGGSAQKVMSPSWTDTLEKVTCTFDSTGTVATQNPFLGDPARGAWSKGITVSGVGHCPIAHATSTSRDPCASIAVTHNAALFQWTIDIEGWDDASTVSLKVNAPPSVVTWCNFAAVLSENAHPWGIQAATTVGKFREGAPFPVRFVGDTTLSFDGNTTKAHWDFTMTLAPKR